ASLANGGHGENRLPQRPEIQFDTKGVEFGPWIRRFVAQVKRHWLIPSAAIAEKGHGVVTFEIHKDGAITDVKIEAPSMIAAFNDSARAAIVDSSPTQPLPQEYPAKQAHFTVTFYYNESPSSRGFHRHRCVSVRSIHAGSRRD